MSELKKLSDAEWVNIVNAPEVLLCGGGQGAVDAVAKAFNLIEARLIAKNQPVIDDLQSRLESMEKDAERWRAATRDTEINDIAVYSFDKYGNDKIVMGDEADSVIDAAMQARKGGG